MSGWRRLIHGLEQELLAAPDEEFMAGARELGMNPDMKGSAAFLGVKNLTSAAAARHLRLAYGSGRMRRSTRKLRPELTRRLISRSSAAGRPGAAGPEWPFSAGWEVPEHQA